MIEALGAPSDTAVIYIDSYSSCTRNLTNTLDRITLITIHATTH